MILDESKQWPPRLSGATTNLPEQMSDDWVLHVVNKIKKTDPVLAQQILDALENGKLIKTVSSIKTTNPGKGSVVTKRVGG